MTTPAVPAAACRKQAAAGPPIISRGTRMTDTTSPQTDRPRALHLLEAADFLRDAHFRDGLSVQEIGTALRHMADEADPMVGSLARDGVDLDEIAAMPAAPSAAVSPPPATDRAGLAEDLRYMLGYRGPDHAHIRPGVWDTSGKPCEHCARLAVARENLAAYDADPDAVLSVLPPDGRAAVLTDAERTMLNYALNQAQLRLWRHGPAVEEDQAALNSLRCLADGERDEQQAQQGGPETRETVEYFLQCRQPDDTWEDASSFMDDHEWAEERLATRRQHKPEFEHRLAQRVTTVVVRPLDAAAPVAGQPPADTGEEAQPAVVTLSTRCDACRHTLNWHRNDVGCTVALCVCGAFREPVEELPQ